MSIDDKLRALIKDDTMAYEVDEKVAQIKAAFESEGYNQAQRWDEIIEAIHGLKAYKPDVMTGQEFYDRFKTELQRDNWLSTERTRKLTEHNQALVINAAKRAAGIKEGEG